MDFSNSTQATPPFSSGMLELDERHVMHFQQSGNPHGQPVVILHGGPGAGINPLHRSLFNSLHYRIIEYDQRGAGRSLPHGEIKKNTTQKLIQDIETLRIQLKVSSWLVAGGSWGSTLALLYAQQFPSRVTGLLLRGVFLASQSEIDWYMSGASSVFPEAWDQFISHLPQNERSNPLQGYKIRLFSDDPAVHLPAAQAWCQYEASCSTLLPESGPLQSASSRQTLVLARIQAHYFNANFFLSDSQTLEKIDNISTTPTVIVQGRYDMICPIKYADKLRKLMPHAQYHVVPNAGHSICEPGIRRALASAATMLESVHSENYAGAPHD